MQHCPSRSMTLCTPGRNRSQVVGHFIGLTHREAAPARDGPTGVQPVATHLVDRGLPEGRPS